MATSKDKWKASANLVDGYGRFIAVGSHVSIGGGLIGVIESIGGGRSRSSVKVRMADGRVGTVPMERIEVIDPPPDGVWAGDGNVARVGDVVEYMDDNSDTHIGTVGLINPSLNGQPATVRVDDETGGGQPGPSVLPEKLHVRTGSGDVNQVVPEDILTPNGIDFAVTDTEAPLEPPAVDNVADQTVDDGSGLPEGASNNIDAGDYGDWNKVWDITPPGSMPMKEYLQQMFGEDLTHLATLPSTMRKVPQEVIDILAPYRAPGFDPATITVYVPNASAPTAPQQ